MRRINRRDKTRPTALGCSRRSEPAGSSHSRQIASLPALPTRQWGCSFCGRLGTGQLRLEGLDGAEQHLDLVLAAPKLLLEVCHGRRGGLGRDVALGGGAVPRQTCGVASPARAPRADSIATIRCSRVAISVKRIPQARERVG